MIELPPNANAASAAAAAATRGVDAASFIRQQDLPPTDQEWVSLTPTVQFLPARTDEESQRTNRGASTPHAFDRVHQRTVRRERVDETVRQEQQQQQQHQQHQQHQQQPLSQRWLDEDEQREDNSQYRVQPFVEGVSDYDTYQQAWRMLGFMIDCDDGATTTASSDDDHHSGSGDEAGTGEGCQRYVLWAAYVDLDYQGGGIGEYQFWDADTKKWDTTTCDYSAKVSSGSGRCAKMDCHLEDTHWSLLGFFKHKGYDDWMEQLFKHEGVCVWSDNEYSFMKNARKTWPQGCIVSNTVTTKGETIYYDIKPAHGGSITLGLYTDTKCVKEYQSTGKNDPITAENVIGNLLSSNNGSNDHSNDKNKDSDTSSTYSTLAESLQAWDDSFSIWKQCQPCVAYDRHNYGYSTNDGSYKGSSYGTYRYGYDDDYAWSNYYSSKYSGADFDCYDDAGYTNVNQCMKFMAKTTMYTATFRDLSLATAQGTLVDSPLAGYRAAGHARLGTVQTYIFFAVACLVLLFGIVKYRQARLRSSGNSSKSNNAKDGWGSDKPLVFA